MDRSLTRLLVLLASARVPSHFVRDFLEEARSVGTDRVMAQYRTLRNQVAHLERIGSGLEEPTTFQGTNALGRELDRLLRRDAGLDSRSAAAALVEKLKEIGAASPQLETDFDPKAGFLRWVQQLSENIEPSTIMRAATLIVADRGRRSTVTAWPLRDDD